jgi:hypothetical protein
MNIAKSLSALSLAIAIVGGSVMLAPSSAEAAGKFISIDALKKNHANNKSRPTPSNPHTRGCSKITMCRG